MIGAVWVFIVGRRARLEESTGRTSRTFSERTFATLHPTGRRRKVSFVTTPKGRRIALATLLAMLVGAAAASSAVPKKWYWTESRATTLVLAKVHVPCRTVWPNPAGQHWSGAFPPCDIAAAQADFVRKAAEATDITPCDAFPTVQGQAICQSRLAGARSAAAAALRHAQNGYVLSKAECKGTGLDVDFRFSRFICAVIVEDVARAQLGVYVSGASTFRWQVIG